jgi:hypothetical protein
MMVSWKAGDGALPSSSSLSKVLLMVAVPI